MQAYSLKSLKEDDWILPLVLSFLEAMHNQLLVFSTV